MKHDYDVIIIGAGAAGIACGQKLSEAGIKFLILEGRSRLGGRIFSDHSNPEFPVELGAEFIHGAPGYTLDWLKKLNKTFYDVLDSHHLLKGRGLQKHPEFWEELESFMKKLKPKRKNDLTISQFLSEQKGLNPKVKPYFKSFVEGFHGADLNLMGVKGLASTEETDDDEINGSKMFRLSSSYSSFVEGIFESYKSKSEFKLNFKVCHIRWEKNQVVVAGFNTAKKLKTGDSKNRTKNGFTDNSGKRKLIEFTCKKLVVTVPIGVLSSNEITWEPYPKELQTLLQSVKMGHVQRIAFKFKERFWENLSEKPISFLHAGPGNFFPTWWTYQPLRIPYLLAWQGGPLAEELSRLTKYEKIDCALVTLAKLTRRSPKFLRDLIEETYVHDWTHDPFSYGAYSYILVDGVNGWQKAREIENTLYFAGEGLAPGASRGTVHGAFASGVSAAEKVIQSLTLRKSKRA